MSDSKWIYKPHNKTFVCTTTHRALLLLFNLKNECHFSSDFSFQLSTASFLFANNQPVTNSIWELLYEREWLSWMTKKIERTGDQSLKFWYLFAERLENYRVPLKKICFE